MKQSQTPPPTFSFQRKVCAVRQRHTIHTTHESFVNVSDPFNVLTADGFSSPLVRNLLSPEKVFSLIQLPTGCLQQTTLRLTPTLSAVRYLDKSDQWEDLPPGTRDDALDKIETGRKWSFASFTFEDSCQWLQKILNRNRQRNGGGWRRMHCSQVTLGSVYRVLVSRWFCGML